jgi:hypothetical protein
VVFDIYSEPIRIFGVVNDTCLYCDEPGTLTHFENPDIGKRFPVAAPCNEKAGVCIVAVADASDPVYSCKYVFGIQDI